MVSILHIQMFIVILIFVITYTIILYNYHSQIDVIYICFTEAFDWVLGWMLHFMKFTHIVSQLIFTYFTNNKQILTLNSSISDLGFILTLTLSPNLVVEGHLKFKFY